MDQETFFLDKENYESQYKPPLKNYNFKDAIQFAIILPFEIPLTNNSIVSIKEKNSVLNYHFSRIEEGKAYTAGALQGEGAPLRFFLTRVEMTLFTEKNYYMFNQKEFSDIFNLLLDNLNIYITALQIKGKDIELYRLTQEMLEPSCFYRVVKLENGLFEKKKEGLFLLHMNVVDEKNSISAERNLEIINFAMALKNKENPFVLTEELMLNAMRSYKNGFHKESILHAQTSIETFLRTLFSECLKIEGANQQKIEKIQKETNYITMVKREFSKRIGGSWDITNERNEVGNWYKNCYELRNKIIHSGYDPTKIEADLGLSSARNLRTFVFNRIKNTTKYKSLLMFL